MFRTKRILTIMTLAALAALLFLGAAHATRRAQAQSEQQQPTNDRISFGMVGITRGQTVRLSVANTVGRNDSDWPPGPTRVVLTFLNEEGQPFRNRDGRPVRLAASLERGQSTLLDLNADDLQFPPGPSRVQLRAVINVFPPSTGSTQPPPVPNRSAASVEVFNNSNARTVVFIGNPGVIRGFNPQPDPPVGD